MSGRAFERFMQAMGAPSPDGLSVAALCHACVTVLDVDGAALVLMTVNQPQGAVYASNDVAASAEDLQFTVGEGPGPDAYASGRPVLVADLSVETERWPEFVTPVRALGVEAIFAFPVQVDAVKLGMLSMYRTRAGPLEPDEFADTLTVVATITEMLLAMQSEAAGEVLSWQLSTVADHRAVVHQATGMIAAQLDCGIAEALVRLRAHAYAVATPVGHVADLVVAGDLRLDR